MSSNTARFGLATALAATLLAGRTLAGAAGEHAPAPAPELDRFRALAGDWVAAEDGEMVKKGDLVARYHLTGGGSAVVEELFPGQHHEMTTVYYVDGRDLVLTHYCMSGNQPHMRAKSAAGPRVEFAFDGGSNIDPKRDRHMHNATFEFVGSDEIRTTWTEYDQGKSAMTVAMHLVRKAD